MSTAGQFPACCRGGQGDGVPGQLPRQAAVGGGRGAGPPDQPQGGQQAGAGGQERIRGPSQRGNTGQPHLPPGDTGRKKTHLNF